MLLPWPSLQASLQVALSMRLHFSRPRLCALGVQCVGCVLNPLQAISVVLTAVLRVTGVTTSFLERLVVYGVPKAPAAIKATQSGGDAVNLEFAYDKDAQVCLA